MDKTTDGLVNILKTTAAENLSEVLSENESKMFTSPQPFAAYIKELLKQYGLTQSYIIEKAGFSSQYGYRLLSEERRTKQRDYILRFCFVSGFRLEEIQRLLQLYGMSPLYARIPRDAVLISVVSAHITEIADVNSLLQQNGMPPLLGSNE